MKSNKTSARRSPAMQDRNPKAAQPTGLNPTDTNPQATHPVKRLDGGIEIDLSSSAAITNFDVRFLGVAIQYPYMFANPLDQMFISKNWSAAFRLTCLEIDTFLGEDKRGFHWRQLSIEDGQPIWFWALGPEYDHTVWMAGPLSNPTVSIARSADDPQDELRNAIHTLVDSGMRRALSFGRQERASGEPV